MTASSRITSAFLELVEGRSSVSSNDSHTSLLPPTKLVATDLKDSAGSGKSTPSLIDGIEATASFSWLSAAVRVREQLNFDGTVVLNTIRHEVFSAFGLDEDEDLPSFQFVNIKLGWNPHRFIEEQVIG